MRTLILMHLLGPLNFFVIQWFGLRLCVYGEGIPFAIQGTCLMVGVLPLSGWWRLPYVGPCWMWPGTR